jgi:hypothetical protein
MNKILGRWSARAAVAGATKVSQPQSKIANSFAAPIGECALGQLNPSLVFYSSFGRSSFADNGRAKRFYGAG